MYVKKVNTKILDVFVSLDRKRCLATKKNFFLKYDRPI